MKKVLFLAVMFLFGISIYASAQNAADKVVKFDKEKYDLGKIAHNEPMTFYIEFTNISKKPLVVENVMAGCGCTVPEKPTAPIAAGKKGKIKVGYNASADGSFSKDVTIKFAGVPEVKTILFTGETVDKK